MPLVSTIVPSAALDGGPPSNTTLLDATPDSESRLFQEKVLPTKYVLPLWTPLTRSPVVGAVLSILMLLTVVLEVLPALSVAVPATDWLAPSAEMVVGG